MKKVVLVLAVCVLGLAGRGLCQMGDWEQVSRENINLKAVLVHTQDTRIIYIGGNKGVFKSEDAGRSWRRVLSVRGDNRWINFLLFNPQDKHCLFAATGEGLYRSDNQGARWERVFKGKNSAESECTALAILPGGIYLGTKGGLFISKDKGRSWQKELGKLGSSPTLSIACQVKEPQYIYAVSQDGLFRARGPDGPWERIFVAKATESQTETEEAEEDRDGEGRVSDLRYIALDQNHPADVYLATSRGVYRSKDSGRAWEAMPEYGLLSREIKFLYVSPRSEVYALTRSGVFKFESGRWSELSFGLAAGEVSFLDLDTQGNLYAACDKGLFKATDIKPGANLRQDLLDSYSQGEPKIDDVQEAAIRYAEVEPEKIMRWRRQAAKRAILPKVTIAMDRDQDRTSSSSIWGTYSSNGVPGRYFMGPDDVTKYNNRNWGVSATWELGDLIWSEDQTSIDVRSRLMVQLRDDILDEVTKLYFERLRLKLELDGLSLVEKDRRLEKELRLRELTASIDALTGGYFSRRIETAKGSEKNT